MDNKHAKGKDFVDESEAWVEEVPTYVELAIKLHHGHNVGAKAPTVAPGIAPAGAGAVTKPDQELRPTKLQKDTTMGELRD